MSSLQRPERHRPAGSQPVPAAPRFPVIACAAVLLAALSWAAALAASNSWFDRHVIIPFYFRRPRALPIATRATLVLAGLAALALARPLQRRWLRRQRSGPVGAVALRIALAVGLALVVAEATLRWIGGASSLPAFDWYELAVGRPDARVGWRAIPSRTTVLTVQGRSYHYAVDALGMRAPLSTRRLDAGRPALVVSGESIASGLGLPFEETFAALCGRDLGLEVVDVAEGAYGADQSHLRLLEALQQVERPALVVVVVVPVDVGRSLLDNRPRLVLDDGGGLVLTPPASGPFAWLRLRNLVHNRVPYASDAALDRASRLLRAVLAASAQAARDHGAPVLFVWPSLGPDRPLDAHPESFIIHALFDGTSLPFLVVDLDVDDVIPHDGHPNARGARKLARAIEEAVCRRPDTAALCPGSRRAQPGG